MELEIKWPQFPNWPRSRTGRTTMTKPCKPTMRIVFRRPTPQRQQQLEQAVGRLLAEMVRQERARRRQNNEYKIK